LGRHQQAPAPKSQKRVQQSDSGAATQAGSKTAQILELLKRPGRGSLQELMDATE